MEVFTINILNVNMCLDPRRGGTVERTVQISRHLAKRGHECTILCTDAGFQDSVLKELEGVHLTIVPSLYDRFYIPKISWKILHSLVQQADIVHLMGHWLILNVMVAYMAKRLNKPYVICPVGEILIQGRSGLIKRLFNLFLGNRVIRNASGYIAATDHEYKPYESYGISRNQIALIPNCVNDSENRPLPENILRTRGLIGDGPYVLYVGRLNSVKGPDMLLDAFLKLKERFPDFALVFVGPDEGLLNQLQSVVEKEKLEDRVHVAGFIGGDDKNRILKDASLLVIPSHRDAMPFIVLEAGVLEVPLLATDQCGFNELGPAGAGVIVPASVEGLAGGLETCLANASQLPAMGIKLHKFVQENYLWDVAIDKYIALYEQILERPAS